MKVSKHDYCKLVSSICNHNIIILSCISMTLVFLHGIYDFKLINMPTLHLIFFKSDINLSISSLLIYNLFLISNEIIIDSLDMIISLKWFFEDVSSIKY